MSKELSDRVRKALLEAERSQTGYVPETRRERRSVRRLGYGVVEPLAGIFVRRAVWKGLNPADRSLWLMRALATKHPTWRFFGASAAVGHGLPVTWSLLTHVFVATPPGTKKRSSPGISRHHIQDGAEEVRNGLRLTSLWRTVFDCLATLPEPDALAIADGALRMSMSSAKRLCEHIGFFHKGERGVRRALRVAALADWRAESGGESIARHTMRSLGFADPNLQVWIEDPVEPGRWFRVDYLWMLPDGTIVIGELDGHKKSEDPSLTGGRSTARVLQDERLRESHLTALRPAIVRFDYQTARDPAKLEALLEKYGVPRQARKRTQPHETMILRSELIVTMGMTVLATEERAA